MNKPHIETIQSLIWHVLYIDVSDDAVITLIEEHVNHSMNNGCEITGSDIESMISYFENALSFLDRVLGIKTKLEFDRL